MILFLIVLNVFASDVGNKEVWKDLKEDNSSLSLKTYKKVPIPQKESNSLTKSKNTSSGNLPYELIRSNSQAEPDITKAIVISKLGANNSGLNLGDILECMIAQDIVAYVGSISPIRAEITEGDKKGGAFIGNATLDQKTKNVIVEFNSFVSSSNEIHSLKASIHSVSGELGLKGSHESYYWRFFFASVMARAAQGYAEAQVSRDRNILGQYVQVPGESNAGKIAIAEGASQTANMLSDQMKQAPEWSKVKGPILAKVFILETPKLILRR